MINMATCQLLWHLGFFITGVFCHTMYELPIPYMFLSWASLGVIAFIMHQQENRFFMPSGYLFSLCTGLLLINLQNYQHQAKTTPFIGESITLEGTITSLEQRANSKFCHVLGIQVKNIQTTTQSHHQSFSFLFYAHRIPELFVGDTIKLNNVIIKSSPQNNFTRYLIKEGYSFSLFANKKQQLTLIDRPKLSIQRLIWQTRKNILHNIEKKLTPIVKSFFGLIFLGNKNYNTLNSLRDTFNYWGLSHYLARSGLHIVIFIFLWTYLFKLLPLHIVVRRWLLLFLALIYALLSWSSIAFIRALSIYIGLHIGFVSNHIPNTLHLLILTCFGIILTNPTQCLCLDFQLTFLLTFALLILHHTNKNTQQKSWQS